MTNREELLKVLIASGDPYIVEQVQGEISTIISTIVQEQQLGTRFYKASTMEELLEPKEIFRAMINEDIHFRPTKEREIEYVEMFQGLEKVTWV